MPPKRASTRSHGARDAPDSGGRTGSLREQTRPTVSWQRTIPDPIRALGMLSSPDYADIFTARVDDASGTSIEQRVRTALGGNARARALLIPMIQRVLLGLRLAVRPSRDHLLGWKIAQRGENWFRIEASSWFLTGHVVFHLADGELSIASFVRYDRQVAALIWPPASLIHRQVVHALMRQLVSAS